MVRSRGRGDTSKRKGEPSRGRAKSTLPLALQKIITKKAAAGRGRQPEPSESNSYAPSREASEGDSVQEQPAVQSLPQQPQGRYQLRDEPSCSHSTSEGSESASQASETSSTTVTEAPVATVDDIPDDSRRGDTIVVGLEKSKKKEIWEDRFVSLAAFTSSKILTSTIQKC